MPNLEEKVNLSIAEINALHDSVVRTNWAQLNREGFVFELEKNTEKLRGIYLKLDEINKETKLLLEKNTPDIDSLLAEMARDMTVLEANISMERKKRLRQELVNEIETIEVPELYSSLQQKILSLALKARYNMDRINNFLSARKLPFVRKGSTARNLLEALQQKEKELEEMKEKNIELKRKSYFGLIPEKSIAEVEMELNDLDKRMSEAVSETKKSLSSHMAQISYVEGSFGHLKGRIDEIEGMHTNFTKKSIELIKELKKERDYAKTLALEIEKETIDTRNHYTKQILELEEKKQAIEEKAFEKYESEVKALKRALEEKTSSLNNSHKVIDQLESELKKHKNKN
jgi:chromosome segregation ATPase